MKRSFTYLAAVAFAAAVLPVAVPATSQANVRAVTGAAHANGPAGWGEDWWEWLLGQPFDKSPLYDSTGANCTQGQHGEMWFLAGAADGVPVTRSCTVPKNKSLLFPVVNIGYFGFVDDPPEQRKRDYVRAQIAPAADSVVTVSVDGVDVTDDILFVTSFFKLKLKADNLFGAPKGFMLDPSGDAGYYLKLPPLSPGEHTIHFTGLINSTGFSVDVTYAITVARGHAH